MTSSNGTNESGTAIIGSAKNFWRYNSGIGYDLTHPETPESDKISPSVTIETTASPITVDPEKTALVVIDMQNCEYLCDPLQCSNLIVICKTRLIPVPKSS